MRAFIGMAVAGLLFGSQDVKAGEFVPSERQKHEAISENLFRLYGLFIYQEGDFIVYKCGNDYCGDLLIRDEVLQNYVVQLSGKMIEVEVQRVPACPKSGELTISCVRSVNGSALRIKKWIQPAGLDSGSKK